MATEKGDGAGAPVKTRGLGCCVLKLLATAGLIAAAVMAPMIE